MQYEIEYEFITKGYRGEFITEEETEKFVYYASEEEIVEEIVDIIIDKIFNKDYEMQEQVKELVERNVDYLFDKYEEEVKNALEDRAREEFEGLWENE